MAQYPGVSWVEFLPVAPGLYDVGCRVCGKQERTGGAGVELFAEEHAGHMSRAPAYMGLGDVVHAAALKIGFSRPCEECEERRVLLNRVAPRVWRR